MRIAAPILLCVLNIFLGVVVGVFPTFRNLERGHLEIWYHLEIGINLALEDPIFHLDIHCILPDFAHYLDHCKTQELYFLS